MSSISEDRMFHTQRQNWLSERRVLRTCLCSDEPGACAQRPKLVCVCFFALTSRVVFVHSVQRDIRKSRRSRGGGARGMLLPHGVKSL